MHRLNAKNMSKPEDSRDSLIRLRRLQPPSRDADKRSDSTGTGPQAGTADLEARARQRLAQAKVQEAAATRSDPRQTPAVGGPGPVPQQGRRQQPTPSEPPPEIVISLPPAPQHKRRRPALAITSFVVCVVLPVIAASLYFFLVASDQYAAEFRFVVRDAKSATAGTSVGGLPNLPGGGTMPSSSVENYMVADFIGSKQAIESIEKRIDLKKIYARPDVDWLSRFKGSQTTERFSAYWREVVHAEYDQITGLGSTRVRAFAPEDAYLIATTLLSLSEELVNEIANRPQRDAIKFAENDLRRAEDRLKQVRVELTKFRNTEQIIEPGGNVVASNIALAQTLRANLSQLETELSSLHKQNPDLSASAPVSSALKQRIKATREQLTQIEAQVATARDGSTPLSKVVADYEALDLERQFAQNSVLAAQQALEQARAKALSQQVYVTAYVHPILPQTATYPKRLQSVIVVALIAVLVWTIFALMISSIREHLT